MNFTKTNRGFIVSEFRDYYYQPCSLQKSSIASESCIWLGVDKRTDLNTGKELPDSKNMRMHLSQKMVKDILPALMYFAQTGELPSETHEIKSLTKALK